MKILAIFAHPDDESYGPGGSLAKWSHTGHTVGLITFTRGEAGSLGISKTITPVQLAETRYRELVAAAKVLKLQLLEVGSFPDKGVSALTDLQVNHFLQPHLQRFQHDVLLTFHANGISGHPDHIAVHRQVTRLAALQKSPLPVLYYGLSPDQTEIISNRKLHAIPRAEIAYPHHIGEYIHHKIEAIQCHRSQLELWNQFQEIKISYRKFAAVEHFSVSLRHRILESLFVES
ncbi:MAG: hypothetical protein Kow0037_31450 [Calditrichia bacterium]